MVDVNLSLMGRLNENNQLLTFRNKASFGIRKALRKKAYTMAIDIVIKSVDYNLYENSKANPSIQFYGYCVLVFQDMTSIEIPIHFPRQRLYYAIQREAFRQWRGFVNYYEQYLLHRQNAISLGLILAAFDIPPVEIDSELARTQWIELPLREVYIKCQNNTQFQIEYTAWEPDEFIDPISGLPNNGESNQDDGEKDEGLPKNGIQPNRNSPSNPFENNPSPSSIQELGQKGFDKLDDTNLGNIDPNNIPIPAGYIYVVQIKYTYYSTCPQVWEGNEFYQLQPSDSITLVSDGTMPACQTVPIIYWHRTSDMFRLGGGGIIAVVSQTYQYRPSVPAAYSVRLS